MSGHKASGSVEYVNKRQIQISWGCTKFPAKWDFVPLAITLSVYFVGLEANVERGMVTRRYSESSTPCNRAVTSPLRVTIQYVGTPKRHSLLLALLLDGANGDCTNVVLR